MYNNNRVYNTRRTNKIEMTPETSVFVKFLQGYVTIGVIFTVALLYNIIVELELYQHIMVVLST